MEDECYTSITFSGDALKLSAALRVKLEVFGLKRVNQDKLLVCIQMGSQDDLVFLKSHFESDGIKINNVSKFYYLYR